MKSLYEQLPVHKMQHILDIAGDRQWTCLYNMKTRTQTSENGKTVSVDDYKGLGGVYSMAMV